mgnify:FL=1
MAGFCYQFNSDGAELVEGHGIATSLSFQVDAATDEYSIGPYSFSEGFAVGIKLSH